MQIVVTLRAGSGTDVYLRRDRSVSVDVFLRGGGGVATDVYLRRDGRAPVSEPDGGFYTQFAGLYAYYGGAAQLLCLVAASEPPPAETPLRVRKGGVEYAIYLVATSDPLASSIRVQVGGVTKAVRLLG